MRRTVAEGNEDNQGEHQRAEQGVVLRRREREDFGRKEVGRRNFNLNTGAYNGRWMGGWTDGEPMLV